MKTISGISASPGIAIGKALKNADDSQKIPQYQIRPEQVANEFARFTQALSNAVTDVEQLRSKAPNDRNHEENLMLDTHLLMLQDPDFSDQIHAGLLKTQCNVEYVISQTIKELMQKLSQAKDEYLRERTVDLHDVSRRVLGHLLYTQRKPLDVLSEDVLLVCRDLMPSEAIAMDKVHIKGIAMDGGGKTSHTAILARAFEIPAVLGLPEVSLHVETGDMLIIDGYKGIVIINPDAQTHDQYLKAQKLRRKREVKLMGLAELPAETRDGKLIKLYANIEIPEEADAAITHGADGIGLFRSEFLFLRSGGMPGEEEQYQAYSAVLKAMPDKPVTIRTLDIGGDKILKTMNIATINEKNPILGWRAIRFCLAHEEIFSTQLRAMLRASVHGQLKIMFPLISGLQELSQALVILEETKSDLRRRKIPFVDDVQVGIMVEVPSAAMISDILARYSHFFSIGTNDLIQYSVAVDRGNEHTAYLYDPLHLGVLRFIQTIVRNGHEHGIPVSMCGEMAGDPLYTLVLLGLGLDELSMSSFGIPEVKRIIRSTTVAEAEDFVGRIMRLSLSSEIDDLVRRTMEERFEVGHE